jgi:fatty acid amide hydrolase
MEGNDMRNQAVAASERGTGAARDSICQLPAGELAKRIRSGGVSAADAVEAYIARIRVVNPGLNALVAERFDDARNEAREVDRRLAAGESVGPLGGVPVTVKECLDLAGTAATFGLPGRRHQRATADEKHVARLREAGAIVLGKTNVAQLLMFIETDNPIHGRTNHPLDPQRSPGGSSGGEAALLAAGASALGLGTDLGGSVRVPAAFCGIASLKPTSGRCDDLGRGSCPIGQRAIPSQVGVLARHVADVSLGLEVINGGARPHLDGSLAPAMPLGDPGAVDPSRLRVAFYTDDGTLLPAPAARRAVREAVAALEAKGARAQAWSPPNPGEAQKLFYGILAADGFAGCRRELGRGQRDPRIAKIALAIGSKRLVHLILGASGRGRLKREIVANYGHADTDHYWQLVEQAMDYRRRFLASFEGFDVLVSPASALPAFRHGAAEELVLAGAYTCLFNVLGWPGGVVPVTRVQAGEESDRPPSRDKMDQAARATEEGSTGLPIGVHVAARPWREDLVLAAMQAIETCVRKGPNAY